MTHRVAIAQIAMCWRTADNVAAMLAAMDVARAHGAQLCGFSELAVTGFHRRIGEEAVPERVAAAVRRLAAHAAELSLAVAFGAPTFGRSGEGDAADDGSRRFNAHLLVDEHGRLAGEVRKRGLTAAEATFFAAGASRPVARVHGLRCSAVICREVGDAAVVAADLPRNSVDLVFVPGALRQDPEKPKAGPPDYVDDLRRLALATGAHVVQTNWPNALNRPEESIDGGGSHVVAPDGQVLLRLPGQEAGVAVFDLGARSFAWRAC